MATPYLEQSEIDEGSVSRRHRIDNGEIMKSIHDNQQKPQNTQYNIVVETTIVRSAPQRPIRTAI